MSKVSHSCVCVRMMRNFKIYFLSNFQMYSTGLLCHMSQPQNLLICHNPRTYSSVTNLLICHWKCIPLENFLPFPSLIPPIPCNCQSVLCSVPVFVFFVPHIIEIIQYLFSLPDTLHLAQYTQSFIYDAINSRISFYQFSSVQSLRHVQLFVTPWTAARRPPSPSATPRAYQNSCPLSQ